ncbi:MAG: hypothetical protein K0S29_1168 [Gammaproteobacteria bacterium]|jgi:hypothetical protein|nr:hypothetical protein [Gammaproteobacteria bacterium]
MGKLKKYPRSSVVELQEVFITKDGLQVYVDKKAAYFQMKHESEINSIVLAKKQAVCTPGTALAFAAGLLVAGGVVGLGIWSALKGPDS